MAMTEERAAERNTAERGKAVDAALASIEKQFGRGAIMKLGSREKLVLDTIPTGSIALDLALGVGGIPRGRITEIFGPESSGKTTVCQHVLAEAQARGGVVAFIDVEHALDPGYARACGVNVDELLVSQPDTGEQALEITETLIRSGGIDCVVVDSVAALVPRAEIEGEMGDSFMGVQARLMSQALRKLTGAVSRSNTALIFTNQLREKIGVMFGNPETTPGGRAMKFYASVRLDIRRIETIKTGTESVGNRVRVKVVKNKVAAPFRVAEFDIMYGEGVSKEGGLLDVGVAMDMVTKTGAWFTFGETRLGQGREASKEFLKANPADRQGDRRPDPGQDRRRADPGRGHRGGVLTETRGDAFGGRAPARRSPSARERRAAVDDPAVVLEAAARFLEPRARSVAEVRRRLTGAGYRADLVDGAIERLLELGMLDDEAFARAWVESRDRARPRGERAIRAELGLKGVDRTTIDLVLERASRGGRRDARGRRRRDRRHRTRSRRSACSRATPGARPCRRSSPAPAARLRVARAQRLRPGRLPDGRGVAGRGAGGRSTERDDD